MKHHHTLRRLQQALCLSLALLLTTLPALAGIRVQGTQGLVLTGVDGIYYENTEGLVLTGVDGLLGLGVNGIFGTGSDGATAYGTNGLVLTGVDGVTYTGANIYTAPHADGATMAFADGLTMTGVDGLTMTGVDGTTWQVNSVIIRQADGLSMTGMNGLTMTGVDGLQRVGEDGLTMTGVDGLTMTGVDSIRLNSAAQVIATGTDGVLFSAPANGLTMTGVDGLTMTGVDGLTMTGVDDLKGVSLDGLTMTGVDGDGPTEGGGGLQSFDPLLALELDALTDDSNVNAVVVYHRPVTDADINDLKAAGVLGGTRYRALPMVALTATKRQIDEIGDLPAVRSIYGQRTLQWKADESREKSGLTRMREDSDLLAFRGGMPLEGNGVGVAVLDTGIDATHADLAGRVVRNVKLVDLQGLNPLGFVAPTNVEGLNNTDLAGGHGTFVSGVIAGSGARSGGKFKGYAPKSRLVGLSAGDASLFNVLAGFDYLLARHQELGVRVLNCSFSANALYDPSDPVNVATRLLTEQGVNVVFSAGNSGPGLHSLNPYAAAPWVISVGALDARGRLADFSSRGDFGSRNYRPTLVAAGTEIVSLRAGGVSLTGLNGLLSGTDGKLLSLAELPYYTTGSGTSFSAPQVAGTIALMLEANPSLTPAEVRDILQRTATPLPPYYQHEVGAGALNTYAAVLEAAFPERQIGLFRAVLNREQVRFVKEPAQFLNATVSPGGQHEFRVQVPADAVMASAQIAWGPVLSVNDLSLAVYDPAGVKRAESNYLNLPGLTGRRERTLLNNPAAGTWRVRVRHTLGLGLTAQTFAGVFETARVEHATLRDASGFDTNIQQAVRTFSMWPDRGGYFRPTAPLTRADLAASLVAAGLVPQYMPAQPSFADVRDATTMNFVESAQHAPGGALFPGVARGGAFSPDGNVSRLVAAIVLVRAAGLQTEAEASANTSTLFFRDGADIPDEWRGYVHVAVMRQLVSSDETFEPGGNFTRAELAQALSAIAKLRAQQ
ncbi:MAG TPA: S8 family serine peptidase [Pyrinomonadaceae bacterium]|nr:S8 family serine peptidase [Pyrinomonadaceae bacterium]